MVTEVREDTNRQFGHLHSTHVELQRYHGATRFDVHLWDQSQVQDSIDEGKQLTLVGWVVDGEHLKELDQLTVELPDVVILLQNILRRENHFGQHLMHTRIPNDVLK